MDIVYEGEGSGGWDAGVYARAVRFVTGGAAGPGDPGPAADLQRLRRDVYALRNLLTLGAITTWQYPW